MVSPTMPTIAGSTINSSVRRRASSRAFNDFAVSRALPEGPPGNLSTGSAITPFLLLLVLVDAIARLRGADVLLDGVELLDQALRVLRLQVDQRLLVDLVAQRFQLGHQRTPCGFQEQPVGAAVVLVATPLDQLLGAQRIDQPLQRD